MYRPMERKRELRDEAAGLFATKSPPSRKDETANTDILVVEKKLMTEQTWLPPLLRLPAEIRNEIYSLVLGTNSLHVYARKSTDTGSINSAKVDYYTCLASHAEQEYVKSGPTHPEWLKQHMPCFTDGSPHPPNLALIFTCRQIFAETRLLPFSTNEFTFVAPSSLQTYVENVLTEEQAKALRTVSIWNPVAPTASTITTTSDSTDSTTTWNTWVPSSVMVKAALLQGIQELKLSLSVFASEAADGEWRDMREVEGLFRFRSLATLKRVVVAVGQDEGGGVVEEKAVIKAYAEEVRDKMLGTYVPRPIEVDDE